MIPSQKNRRVLDAKHHEPPPGPVERYRRLARRRGRQRALVAIARSILVVVWHLLADPNARFVDLGLDFYERRVNKDRKTRDLVRQLQALGHQVTLSSAA
jgi:transposase